MMAIRHATVPIIALAAHPRNYRAHPEAQVQRLAASLARFSQVRSIVVQEGADGRYLIVAGHGVVEAARQQGMTALHADIIPATWTPTQIEGYLISDNESARGVDDDLTQLAAMLEEQRNAGEHLESLGFSDADLAALLEELAENATARTTELNDPEGGEVKSGYSVLVECVSEGEQQRAYELLTNEGFTCRILTL